MKGHHILTQFGKSACESLNDILLKQKLENDLSAALFSYFSLCALICFGSCLIIYHLVITNSDTKMKPGVGKDGYRRVDPSPNAQIPANWRFPRRHPSGPRKEKKHEVI